MALLKEVRSQPTCSASAFGRIFYGAADRLYFSQVFLDDLESLGRCYQKNDPTAEVASDILDTDGGEILLQESGPIVSMVQFQLGILLFCSRGVWYVSGSDSGFTATSYKVDKVSSDVIVGPRAYSLVGSDVVFGTKDGASFVSSNEFGIPKVTSITDFTIKTFWQGFVTPDLQIAYDQKNLRVIFLKCTCAVGGTLVYDLRVQGFFPWELGGTIVEGEEIVYEGVLYSERDSKVLYIARQLGLIGDISRIYTASQSDSPVHRDFGVANYQSYLTTNYETLGNYTRNKGVPLVSVFFRKTETNVNVTGSAFVFDRPSACNMSVLWDFDTVSGKYSEPKSVYNPVPRGWAPPDVGIQAFDTGQTIINYKDKIRGKGKAVQFRFESVGSNSMELLGFSVQYTAKGRM